MAEQRAQSVSRTQKREANAAWPDVLQQANSPLDPLSRGERGSQFVETSHSNEDVARRDFGRIARMISSPYNHQLRKLARELRKQMTPAERLLWERLRGRRLGGYKFVRQWVLLDRIVDFYCHESSLIIELDGEVHLNEDIRVRDFDRDVQARISGYETIRVPNSKVLLEINSVCDDILQQCLRSADCNNVKANRL